MGSLFRHALLTIAATVCGAIGGAAHPLDALTAEEIHAAVQILRAEGRIDAATRFSLIDLDEPVKAEMLAWRPPESLPRRAFVVARHDRVVYEGVVDLAARQVARWQRIPDVQSSILVEEWDIAQAVTKADAAWQAAMRRRGYDRTAVETLFCAPLSAGYVSDPAEAGRRLLRVACFDPAGARAIVWGRPIEGVTATVDLDAQKVIRVIDTGVVPMSRDAPPALRRPAKPLPRPTRARHSFTVRGSEVRWADWAFHFRMDRRAGLILSLVRRQDGGRARMVLYRGSVAEMFVPYMDPDPNWSFRTYLDVGELGFGLLASSLRAGIDCPPDAQFFDAVLPDDRGQPVIGRAVVCLFERATGAPLWRHAEIANGAYQGRPAVELVLRTIPAVGNYDYVIDWVLTEAGVIRVDVGATGIDEVKGVASRSMADPTAASDTAHGPLVAPHLVAVNHDHFLSLRLDVDIDGAANTLIRQRLTPQPPDVEADRRGVWVVTEDPVAQEGPLGTDAHGAAEIWRIVNPNLTDQLGRQPGYELRAGHEATSLLPPDDVAQRRAGFSGAPLWITAYDPHELYAAGPYPNQSSADAGLPAYAAQHRAVANADIVLWYTLGFHHLPRPEDWPLLPTMWHSVSLVPYGFFDRNPGLEVRRGLSPPAGVK
jgi:primary-amine oxidase